MEHSASDKIIPLSTLPQTSLYHSPDVESLFMFFSFFHLLNCLQLNSGQRNSVRRNTKRHYLYNTRLIKFVYFLLLIFRCKIKLCMKFQFIKKIACTLHGIKGFIPRVFVAFVFGSDVFSTVIGNTDEYVLVDFLHLC